MIEQRQFHRVNLTEQCELTYQDTVHQGQLENISLNGAVASFAGRIPVQPGTLCLLTVYLKGETHPLRLNVEIIHSNLAMVGMRIASLDECGQACLVGLVKSFTSEPDQLAAELERIKWHIANYLRAS